MVLFLKTKKLWPDFCRILSRGSLAPHAVRLFSHGVWRQLFSPTVSK
jgi:hypothetical protein